MKHRFHVRPDNQNFGTVQLATDDENAAYRWATRAYGFAVTVRRFDDPSNRFEVIRPEGQPAPTLYVRRVQETEATS